MKTLNRMQADYAKALGQTKAKGKQALERMWSEFETNLKQLEESIMSERYEVTDIGQMHIVVYLQDKTTGEIIRDADGNPVERTIKRAELARALQPLNRTCHRGLNGKFVIEI